MRFIKQIILIICRAFCKFLKTIGFGSYRKQILFFAENQQMIFNLREIWQRLQDDKLSLNVAFDNDIDPDIIAAEAAILATSPKRIRLINYRLAMIWPWDLVIIADCSTSWKLFSISSKKLRIRHGIPAGRLVASGKDMAWSEWLWKKDKKPAYDMVFVTSYKNQEEGINQCPLYKGRIQCVGDLRFDNLLEDCNRKEKIRNELNIPKDRKVVLVISSWGPKSLLHTVGKQLYQECSKLADRYHFIITAHPRNYHKDKNWITIIEQQISWGATIINPSEDWVPFMAVADALITDYTSMSLYFVPLLKPIISIPIPKDFGAPNSAMYRMENIATRLDSPDKLKGVLDKAFSSEISDEHRAFAEEIVSHQGRAWIEMRKHIYKLLSLNEPIS